MTCPRCGDEMIEAHVEVCFCQASPPRKVVGVPAEVCETCGERLYGEDAVRTLEALRGNGHGSIISQVDVLLVHEFDELSLSGSPANGNGVDLMVSLNTEAGLRESVEDTERGVPSFAGSPST